MNRLRNRLIAVFLVATLVPLGLTLWTALRLLESSLGLAPLGELEAVSRSLERTGRELYQQARESLKRDAAAGRLQGGTAPPERARAILERNAEEEFELAGERGERLDYYVRRGSQVLVYSRPMGVAMSDLTRQYAEARQALETAGARDFRRGFSRTLFLVAAALWLAALAGLIYLASRITRPVRQLTQGLGQVAAGDLAVRLPAGGGDEIGTATRAFNDMTQALEQSRERLVHVTRLASWQALARKMAHEVKNSLTPIRLTMEEIASRRAGHDGQPDGAFLEQAAQIVVDEVQTLERRVRAFSEFAAEPPVLPAEVDVNALLEERVSLLRSAHPEVVYELKLAPQRPRATADPDLLKGVLTNLLENAAQAAQSGGVVLARTAVDGERLNVEVHDSGPGLSPQARATLFEPSISFKKGGMGLGLSIAKKSAMLCGGDLQAMEGELGGAAFRLVLAARGGAS
jgi:nitrogen fixation/metabolism regulation signal transduction histidine kinase